MTIEVASSEERVRARSPVASSVCRECVQVSVECVSVCVREGRGRACVGVISVGVCLVIVERNNVNNGFGKGRKEGRRHAVPFE